MNFNEYQAFFVAHQINYQIQESDRLAVLALGLAGETGEAIEHIKKFIRDGKLDKDALSKELGDLLAYLSLVADYFDFSSMTLPPQVLPKIKSVKMTAHYKAQATTAETPKDRIWLATNPVFTSDKPLSNNIMSTKRITVKSHNIEFLETLASQMGISDISEALNYLLLDVKGLGYVFGNKPAPMPITQAPIGYTFDTTTFEKSVPLPEVERNYQEQDPIIARMSKLIEEF